MASVCFFVVICPMKYDGILRSNPYRQCRKYIVHQIKCKFQPKKLDNSIRKLYNKDGIFRDAFQASIFFAVYAERSGNIAEFPSDGIVSSERQICRMV